METIFETLQDKLLFNQFLKLLNETDFWEILGRGGPYTVFAPLDDAFKNLPEKEFSQLLWSKDKLNDLISEHIVIGRISMKDLKLMDEVSTISGRDLAIEQHNEGLIVDGAKIIESDIKCINGYIHAIDLVI